MLSYVDILICLLVFFLTIVFACTYYFMAKYFHRSNYHIVAEGVKKNLQGLLYLGFVCLLRFMSGAVHAILWNTGTTQLSCLLLIQLTQMGGMLLARELYGLSSVFWCSFFATCLKMMLHLILLLEVLFPELVIYHDGVFGSLTSTLLASILALNLLELVFTNVVKEKVPRNNEQKNIQLSISKPIISILKRKKKIIKSRFADPDSRRLEIQKFYAAQTKVVKHPRVKISIRSRMLEFKPHT